MKLDFRVDAGRVYDALRGMEEFADAPREALVEVANLRVAQQSAWIKSAAPYKPLTPRSARRKARKGRPMRPLVGGALEKSLTSERAKYSVRRLNKQSVVVGTRDPVAHLHQKGARGGKLPVRKVVNVSKADADAFREVFADGIAARVTGNNRARRFAA